jgi:hypothetical protein
MHSVRVVTHCVWKSWKYNYIFSLYCVSKPRDSILQTETTYVRFQVLMAASLMFRVVFRGAYCLHHDGGSTHLRNVGRQSFYTAVWPRRQLWTETTYFTESCCSCFQCELVDPASRVTTSTYFVLKLHMKANFCLKAFFDHCKPSRTISEDNLLFVNTMHLQEKVPN